jgi:hypothetical protein
LPVRVRLDLLLAARRVFPLPPLARQAEVRLLSQICAGQLQQILLFSQPFIPQVFQDFELI